MEEKTFYQEEIQLTYDKMQDVRVIRVIHTRLLRRGDGTPKDPIRRIEQYWSMDGKLLWEIDPYVKPRRKRRKK